MKFEDYKLYKNNTTQSPITGQLTDKWVYVDTIGVMTSTKLYSTVENDIVYRKYEPTGITRYKNFIPYITYKIENEIHSYDVTSLNTNGKYSQLLLKEVIRHG